MNESYMWSPSTLGFYPVSLIDLYKAAGTFPSDAVDVTLDCYIEYGASIPPAGKARGVGPDKMPTWVDAPSVDTSGSSTTSGATTSGATTSGATTSGATTSGSTTSGSTSGSSTTSGATTSGATTSGATTSGSTAST